METVEIPAKFKSVVETIETMSVLDLNELVKVFEKKFGVSAAAVAAAAPPEHYRAAATATPKHHAADCRAFGGYCEACRWRTWRKAAFPYARTCCAEATDQPVIRCPRHDDRILCPARIYPGCVVWIGVSGVE